MHISFVVTLGIHSPTFSTSKGIRKAFKISIIQDIKWLFRNEKESENSGIKYGRHETLVILRVEFFCFYYREYKQ